MKVLVMSFVPAISSSGGGIRTQLIIKLLQLCNFDVSLFLVYPKKWGPLPNEIISEMNKNYDFLGVYYFDFKKGFSLYPKYDVFKILKEISKNYDYVLFRFDVVAFLSGFYLLKKMYIIDLDDYYYNELPNLYEKIKELGKRIIIKKFSKGQIVLENKLKKIFPQSILIPNLPHNYLNGTFLDFKKQLSEDPTILFVGSMPEWLVEYANEEWHKILEIFPDAKLKIVSREKEKLDKLNIVNNVFIYNNVTDLVPFYSEAWVSVVPSKHKYGTLIKIVESIFYKTPVVCSSEVLRGYEFFNANEELIKTGDTYLELTKKILELIHSKEKISIISEKAYQLANTIYSLENLAKSLKQII